MNAQNARTNTPETAPVMIVEQIPEQPVLTGKIATGKTVKIGGLDLPVIDSDHANVPTSAYPVKLPADTMEAVALGIRDNMPILLTGETGTGKTSLARYIAYKTKRPYFRISMNGQITPEQLVGMIQARNGSTYFADGMLVQAMRQPAIVCVDEINATPADTTFIFHSLLDQDGFITLETGEIVRPHPDFRFIATMNEGYSGTKILNQAFYDRFPIALAVKTPTPVTEAKILTDRTGIPETEAKKLVLFATMSRKAYRERKATHYIGTRSLLHMALVMSKGMSAEQAIKTVILQKAQAEERQAILDTFNASYGLNVASEDDELTVLTMREVKNKDADIKNLTDKLDAQISLVNEARNDLNRALETVTEKERQITNLQDTLAGQETEKTRLTKELTEAQDKLNAYKLLENIIKNGR